MSQPNPRSIALVDLSYLFRKNYLGAGANAPPGEGARRTMAELDAFRRGVDHLIVCLDAPPYRRRDKFPAYKAQREAIPPEELEQKQQVVDQLKREGYPIARSRGYEADDCAATLAKRYGAWCKDVRIVASDKDCAQCITDNVCQYIPAVGGAKPRPAEKRDRLKCKVKFGVYPEEMILWQAMVGDTADNIPGVKNVGEKKAAYVIGELVAAKKPVTLTGLAELLATGDHDGGPWALIAGQWETLKQSLDLVTLCTDVPLLHEVLLQPGTPDPTAGAAMGVALDGFEPNQTPQPGDYGDIAEEPPSGPREAPLMSVDPFAPVLGPSRIEKSAADARGRAAAGLVDETGRERRPPASNDVATPPGPAAAPVAERPPVTEAQFEPAVPPAAPPPPPPAKPPAPAPAQAKATTALATTKAEEWGLVTNKLQPTDLLSAWTLAKWLCTSDLYTSKFKTAAQVFAVIHRGVELGLDVGTALSAFHMIDGKPSMSADLIRSLAKRHVDCEYFYCESSDDTQATWVTRNRRHPPGVIQRLTYTIEEAKQVPSLWKKDRYGGPSMWEKYPKPMLSKTASTMLARQEWESAMIGFYCPEELGNGYIDTTAEAA